MHVLVVHSDPRFYRELRGLLSAQEATGAYIPNLSEIRAQIEAHFPDLIVLEQRCLSDGGEFLVVQRLDRADDIIGTALGDGGVELAYGGDA